MGKITRSSFFLTVFSVSLIWFAITLMILMFHEDAVSSRTIRAHLEIQKELESADHFVKVHNKKAGVVRDNLPENVIEMSKSIEKAANPKLDNKLPHFNLNNSILEEPRNKSISNVKRNVQQRLLNRKSNLNDDTAVNNMIPKIDTAVNKSKHKTDTAIKQGLDTSQISEMERLKHLNAIAPLGAPGMYIRMSNDAVYYQYNFKGRKRESVDVKSINISTNIRQYIYSGTCAIRHLSFPTSGDIRQNYMAHAQFC